MKNLKNIFVLMSFALIALFAGCSDINTQTGGKIYDGKGSKISVNLSVTAEKDIIDFSKLQLRSAARSILPSANEGDGVEFYLFYSENRTFDNTTPHVDHAELNFNAKEISPGVPNNKEGTIDINIDKKLYNFELYAVKELSVPGTITYTAVKDAACLVAKTTADIRYQSSVDFYMNAEGLKKEGNVNLTLKPEGWGDATAMTAILDGYNIEAYLLYTKDTTVGNSEPFYALTEVQDASNNAFTKVTIDKDDFIGTTGAKYEVSDVTPGTYLFEIKFSNVTTGEEYFWHDTILILPDTDTIDEILIYPVIEEAPKEPEDFLAGYIDVDGDSEFYAIELTWNGENVKNEYYYEVEWIEVPKKYTTITDTTGDVVAQPTDDAGWTALCTDYVITEEDEANLYNGKNFKTDSFTAVTLPNTFNSALNRGSLTRNSQHVVFKATYGKRYAVRLRAIGKLLNKKSAWVYPDIATGITATPPSPVTDATGFTSTIMNRFKVKYVIENGEFTDENTSPANSVTVPVVYTYSYEPGKLEDAATPPTDYYNTIGVTKKYYDTPTGGIGVMWPDGETPWSYDGTDYATKLLLKSGNNKWTYWTYDVDGVSTKWNEKGSKPIPYYGFENITFVANFSITGNVYIYDHNDHRINEVTSTITGFTNEGDNYYVELDSPNKLDLTVSPQTDDTYERVEYVIYSTSSQAAKRNGTFAFNSGAYETHIDFTGLLNGYYRVEIRAHHKTVNDPFTAQVTVKWDD